MNQCVPSWDLDDPINTSLALPPAASAPGHHPGAGAGVAASMVPMSDVDVAELTWKNGHISSHGLTKAVPKCATSLAVGWNKHENCSGGGDGETLEAVVSEATRSHLHTQTRTVPVGFGAAAWLGVGGAHAAVDALVPCARDEEEVEAAARRKRARVLGGDGRVCTSQGSAAPGGRGESALVTLDARHGGGGVGDDVCGFTTTTTFNSTSLSAPLDGEDKGSPETENTSIGGGANDSLYHSRPSQRDGADDEAENVVKGDVAGRLSISTKRSRAAATHNESERKRRDRINQKMKILQKLVPNSSKTDKASMLDEVIDYLKQLQAQVQMMKGMSSMMMPMAMPQLQMSMMANMAQMAQMAQMGMGLGMMNMGSLGQPSYAGLLPLMLHPSAFAHLPSATWDGASSDRVRQPSASAAPDPLSAFLARQPAQSTQQQPTSIDAYNRMVSLYQQLYQQNQPSNSKQ